jgi:hypothetical protein
VVKKETVVPITHVNGVDLAYEEYGDGFPLIWVEGQASKLIQQTAFREFPSNQTRGALTLAAERPVVSKQPNRSS